MRVERDKEKKPIIVAVVDSGIDTSFSDLSSCVSKPTGFCINDEGFIVENTSKNIQHLHGTAIAMIIKHICKNVQFVSVNIFNERLATDGRVLNNALYEIMQYKPDIINLSLGTLKWRYKRPLQRIVKEATKQNIYIVSAANNQGVHSYPAYLKGVIGVKSANNIEINEYYYQKKFFYAPGTLEGINGSDEFEDAYSYSGSSLSAAYITGHLANLISDYYLSNKVEASQMLKNNLLIV